ncbi:hypothetical protein OIE42_00075 [Streptomyces sp. NBC_00648]
MKIPPTLATDPHYPITLSIEWLAFWAMMANMGLDTGEVRRRGPRNRHPRPALLHHCEVISIHGPSFWVKNRLKVIERENEVA